MNASEGLRVPPYFDGLLEGYRRGEVRRFVHLGYWDAGAPEDEDFEGAQQRLDRLHRTLADLHDGQAVLDVGCGFGGTLEAMDATHGGMLLAGVNIDRRQLGICRSLAPAACNEFCWVQADACALPFRAARFDRVLCVEAMFHFRSRRTFFAEAARVLKAGGALVCSDIVLTQAESAEVPPHVMSAALRQGYGPWPDPWGEEGTHTRLAAGCGFECTAMCDITAHTAPSYRFTAPSCADAPARIVAPETPPALRAALALRWLHTQGGLSYRCFRFVKSSRGAAP
jgi:MPBQ/MSBQ methyltransferase